MTYIKDNYPQDKYEAAFKDLWVRMWEQHWDLSKPEKMAETLAPILTTLSDTAVNEILDGTARRWYRGERL